MKQGDLDQITKAVEDGLFNFVYKIGLVAGLTYLAIWLLPRYIGLASEYSGLWVWPALFIMFLVIRGAFRAARRTYMSWVGKPNEDADDLHIDKGAVG